MSERALKVAVSIPNEGHTHVEAYANRLYNFMHLGTLQERGLQENRSPRYEFYFMTCGRILTAKAREEAGDWASEMGADYLYMIDDDMICPDDLFERLVRHNVDIVAPLAFTRNFPHHPVLYDVKEGWDPIARSNYFINHFIDDYPKDSLVECDAVGFGAILIKGHVLQKIAKPRFMSSCGTGEDVLFCHKARKAGFKVYMDTSTKLGHISHPIIVNEEYRDRVHKEVKYEEKMSLKSKRKATKLNDKEAILILGD